MATIFDKLGGSPAISLVVDTFYDTMLADPETAHFFKTTDMAKQRQMQKDFITMVHHTNYEGSRWTKQLQGQGHERGSQTPQDYRKRLRECLGASRKIHEGS